MSKKDKKGRTARPQNERQNAKACKALKEAAEQVSARHLYSSIECALYTIPHQIKAIQATLISCANFKLIRSILLDCELGKLPTADEIETIACKIYNELISPPTWDYRKGLQDFIDTQSLYRKDSTIFNRLVPSFFSSVNYDKARRKLYPEEYISITPLTDKKISEVQARTGMKRTQIFIDLLEIAAQAGLCEQIQAKAAAAPEPSEEPQKA